MASQVTIQIVNNPIVDDYFVISTDIGGTAGVSISEIFKTTRGAVGQSTIGSSVNQTALNLKNALDIDYNSTLLYSITRAGDTVTIVSNNPYLAFTVDNNTNPSDVVITVTNDALTPFTIDSLIGEEAASNPCDNIKITVTTSAQADNIVSPISAPVGANPYSFTVARGISTLAVVMEKDGDTDTEFVRVPQLLAAYFELDVVVNAVPEGTLNVSTSFPPYTAGAVLLWTPEYSLNGTDWQTSPIFTGLALGSYTLYIRDGIGCSITIDFDVDEFTPNVVDYEPIVEISNLNSLAFKRLTTWSDDNPRNPYNTLSYEEDIELPNRYYKQLFTTADTAIKTQVKTNYDTVEAFLVDCDGAETALTVTKVTDNMDKTDVRDGTLGLQLYNGIVYAAVWFGSGNTYDPDTLVANGTYNLGESLPSWLNVGDYISIEGLGWIEVIDILYRTAEQVYEVVLNALGAPLPAGTYKITSQYNAVDFERYEFTVDMSALLGDYYVRVEVSDSVEATVIFRSEWFDVQVSHLKTHRLDYYNTESNEINFSTGISFRLRLPYVLAMKWKPATEQEIYVTDTNVVPIDAEYRPQWELNLRPLPWLMAEKVTMALLQDRLQIDGVSYVTEGKPESKNLGGEYQIKATLTKQDYVFDSNNSTAGEITLGSGEPLEIDDNASGLLFID